MTTQPANETFVFADHTGHLFAISRAQLERFRRPGTPDYFVIPRATLDQCRVSDERRAAVEQRLAAEVEGYSMGAIRLATPDEVALRLIGISARLLLDEAPNGNGTKRIS